MIIDVHVHTRLGPDPGGFQYLLDQAEALDVTLCVNSLSPKDGTGMPYDPTEDEVKRCNDWTAELAAAHPARIIPMWYLNPAHGDFACRELEQRVAAYTGLQGVKLWVAVRCNDSASRPHHATLRHPQIAGATAHVVQGHRQSARRVHANGSARLGVAASER